MLTGTRQPIRLRICGPTTPVDSATSGGSRRSWRVARPHKESYRSAWLNCLLLLPDGQMPDRDPTRIGAVRHVLGAQITVALDTDLAGVAPIFRGRLQPIGQIGSLVRFPQGLVDLLGQVSLLGISRASRSASSSGRGANWGALAAGPTPRGDRPSDPSISAGRRLLSRVDPEGLG